MRQSKLLVAVGLLLVPSAPSADRKHKQPMSRHEKGKFVAFAYTSQGLTKEGKPPVAGITIAADPEVLPLGSRVRVSGAGPWSGEYRVGDTGGRIKGRKLDIFVPNRKEAIVFGRREVVVSVISSPVRQASSEGTRARKSSPDSRRNVQERDIITIDEARGTRPDRGTVASRGTRSISGPDDSWEDGSTPALAGVSALTRTSAN